MSNENKSFAQELIERENRKQAWRDAHGLNKASKQEPVDEENELAFEEQSTGKLLLVERTADQYEFNSYLCDKEGNLINSNRISTLFDKNISAHDDGLAEAANGAMECFGIDKTDVFIIDKKDFWNVVLQNTEKQNKESPLTVPITITVNGKERNCPKGVLVAAVNAIKQNDTLVNDYNLLVKNYNTLAEENEKLRQQLNSTQIKSTGNSY